MPNKNVLRDLIKQLISEMPLASISDQKYSKQKQSVESEDVEEEKDKLKKFNTSKGFKHIATKLYKNLGTNIHIIPVYDEVRVGATRYRILSNEKVAFILKELNFSDEEVQNYLDYLSAGDAILLAKAGYGGLEAGFQPSPWMIIHAMIDESNRLGDDFFDIKEEIEVLLGQFANKLYKNKKDEYKFFVFRNTPILNSWSEILTMNSARAKFLDSNGNLNDIATEIMCQEILTTKGFVYKPSSDEEANTILSQIENLVNGLKQKFNSFISGKCFVVEVSGN